MKWRWGPLGPQPEKPAVPDNRQNGLEVGYRIFSINDKSLGAGEPIRVRQGQRLLVHVLNASATGNRSIAFAGHLFNVVALDGNPVAAPHPVEVLALGSGRARGRHRGDEPARHLDSGRHQG